MVMNYKGKGKTSENLGGYNSLSLDAALYQMGYSYNYCLFLALLLLYLNSKG